MLAKAFIRVLAAMVAATITVSALAQNDPLRNSDPVRIPKGETEIQYRKPEEIPRQLRAAIGVRCNYRSRLAELPIRIVRPDTNGQLIALVPCDGAVINSISFVIGRRWLPSPISFTVKADSGGFGITRTPGYLEWHAGSKSLTATQFTDIAPGHEWRHTYRYVRDDFPFVLTRIEYRLKRFGHPDQPWISYWEGPKWKITK